MASQLQPYIDRYLRAHERAETVARVDRQIDEELADEDEAEALGVDDYDDDDDDDDDDEEVEPMTDEELAAALADEDDDDDDPLGSAASELAHATRDLHAALGGRAVQVSGFPSGAMALIPRPDGSIERVELHRP